MVSSGLWAPWNEGDGKKAGCSRVIGQKGGRVSRHPYLVQSSNSTLQFLVPGQFLQIQKKMPILWAATAGVAW